MTKRDFELIATTIRQACCNDADGINEANRDCIAQHFAAALARANDRFDPTRFLKACGVEA